MRITKIAVTGLFGYLDHEIPLNQESRITIIHGPNGVGKTVLMQMLHGLFHFDYEYIGGIPFEEFYVEFDGGTVLTVEKRIKADEVEESTLFIQYIEDIGEQHRPFTPKIWGSEARWRHDPMIKRVSELYPDFTAIVWLDGRLCWIKDLANEDLPKDGVFNEIRREGYLAEVFTKEELLDQYPELHDDIYGEMPDWFEQIREKAKTNLISTRRLLQEITSGQRFSSRTATDIIWASNRLVTTEQVDYLAENFLGRALLFPGQRNAISEVDDFFESLMREEFYKGEAIMMDIKELKELQGDESALRSLITEELEKLELLDIEDLKKLIERRINNLESELNSPPHGDYWEFWELIELLNERLLFKSLNYDEGGFYVEVESDSSQRVPVPTLWDFSSGEQHLLILYYQLFIETKPDTLVMIDEPELSMNVVWQRNFLKDLQRIVELRKFDVLIATHSPMVIHDKWDWVVHLGEKVDD